MLPTSATTAHLNDVLLTDTFEPFDPHAYVREYYSSLGPENRELLYFLNTAYKHIFAELDSANMLEFGGGPTIYQLISAAHHPVSIDFSDYLDANLDAVRAWLQDAPEAFQWDNFVRYALACEEHDDSPRGVAKRMQLVRDKVRCLMHCDAKVRGGLEYAEQAPYDIVSVNFVLESITTDMAEWDTLVDNVVPLVRPDGYLVMCAIVNATYYRVGERFFPAVPITPELLSTKLAQQGFSIALSHTIPAEHQEAQGYTGISMILARKDNP